LVNSNSFRLVGQHSRDNGETAAQCPHTCLCVGVCVCRSVWQVRMCNVNSLLASLLGCKCKASLQKSIKLPALENVCRLLMKLDL